jgi:hypothetical protein
MGVELHGDGLSFAHQVGFNEEGVSVDFVNHIVVFLLIQSKRQARPASAGGHVDPDGGHFLSGEVHVELLFGSLGQFKHGILLCVGMVVVIDQIDVNDPCGKIFPLYTGRVRKPPDGKDMSGPKRCLCPCLFRGYVGRVFLNSTPARA